MADEPHADLGRLLQRLEAIEQRMNRLEEVLERRQILPRRPLHSAESSPAPRPQAPPEARVRPEEVEEPITVLPADQPEKSRARKAAKAPPRADRPRQAHTLDWLQPRGDLEQLIGLKWAGWIGAIVLAIGVGLGIKFAYERGWLGHIPVEIRLALMSLVGFALLAAGEIVYRRVNVLSAAALFGAGVAVLFLVSYAGNTYYRAYPYSTAFVFALLTTLIGSAVAIRGRLVSIAVLSQLGGQLGPLILSTGQPPGIDLLGYVLMLQIVALILALWGRGPKWWVLRALSLAGTTWWVVVALLKGRWGQGLGHEVLWACVLYAAGYQGELVRSALLADSREQTSQLARGSGTFFSLLVSAGLTAVALFVFYDYDSAALRGGATLLLAACCLAAGFLVPTKDSPLAGALAVSYRVQAMALVILFVPVTFTDVWISLAWGILSLAFAMLGARFDRDLARGAALVTWLLAAGWLLFEAQHSEPARQTWLVLIGHSVAAYTVIAWLLAIAGQVVAWLLQTNLLAPTRDKRSVPQWIPPALVVSVVASFAWASASIDGLPHVGATVALLLWAWVLFGADFVPQELHWAWHALTVVFFAAVKWALVDELVDRTAISWDPQEYLPVLNPVMGVGAMVAASLVAMAWLKRSTLQSTPPAPSLPSPPGGGGIGGSSPIFVLMLSGLTLVILTVGLSFEVDRFVETAVALGRAFAWPTLQVKLFGWTILWLAAILVFALVERRLRYPTRLPWLLFLVVAGQFLLIDMLLMRLADNRGPAKVLVVVNFQVLTAAVVVAGLVFLRQMSRAGAPSLPSPDREAEDWPTIPTLQIAAYVVAALIVLQAGTLEIDRAFASSLAADLADPRLAEQVAISIFWSLFAITAVVAGFRFRIVWLRYFGLSLFGVTLLKVMLIDLSEVQFGYRILSLLGLGLLLLITSVVYGFVGSKLLREPPGAKPGSG